MDAKDSGPDGSGPADLYALLKRRGFLWPSFEIYGGVAGFYDLGPLGSLLRENIERRWRDRFVLDEGFQLVDCPSITPEVVFKHSGHLEKFSDLITSCAGCAQPFRADHLIETPSGECPPPRPNEVADMIADGRIVCPQCGGPLSAPEEFNLMFQTNIGPGKDKRAFLRPETAQNIFINFAMLYRHARGRIPFGVAQIGKGYRNEISPRQGLIRLREFHMAEGEFFFDPLEKGFAPFDRYRNLPVNLMANTSPDRTFAMTLGEAVDKGIINSEVLANFIGVTLAFALSIGIDRDRIRFRQHLRTEMAHYARDCWDMEVATSYGWIEMVGIADRSAYDLSQHSKGSGTELYAVRKFPEPKVVKGERVVPDMKALGPLFRGKAKEAAEILVSMGADKVREQVRNKEHVDITIDGKVHSIPRKAFVVSEFEDTVHQERFVPNVVEPSFGIDRLMLAVLEHSYHEDPGRSSTSEDGTVEKYRVLKLDPSIAPIKCGVFPLLNKPELCSIALALDKELRSMGVHSSYDASDSIGRRYARMDEVGTPYCITVDHDSLDDHCATIRERDTSDQVRVPVENIPEVIEDLVSNRADLGSLKMS
jgi:glycyl-tRNA synthetase